MTIQLCGKGDQYSCQFNRSNKSNKADPMWAPFTALRNKELGIHISAGEVGLPISLRVTDSVKH